MLETAECTVSSDFKRPRIWIDINQAAWYAINYRQAVRPAKLYFVKILLTDRFYSHGFEIFVSETEDTSFTVW